MTLPWPWFFRRRLLSLFFGYNLHASSRMGLCWFFPKKLVMEAHSSIGHMTVCKGLEFVHLKESAIIGRGNWITGFPQGGQTHFTHQPERKAQLVVGAHSAITNRHLIDCTNSVEIGAFSTFAGFNSQILTHSIDLEACRQSSAAITIGDYCFVGTNCVLLGGSRLPNYSVLGAKSLLNKPFIDTHTLYAGVPARAVKVLANDLNYFKRTVGFVN
jgi:acetyltransferase-like isoleucine patch superfamily enzyme